MEELRPYLEEAERAISRRLAMDLSGRLASMGFVLGERVGGGSYGDVYLAERGSERFAIKVFKVPEESNIERSNLIALGRNARIIEFFPEYSGLDFNIFEYMDANLKTIIYEEKAMNFVEIQTVFTQILEAVAYVHSQGFIHADIKPSNILGSRDRSTFKLADFGSVLRETEEGCFERSTPIYEAPEVLLYDCEYGLNPFVQASDIWSLACMFFEVIARRQLFVGKIGRLGIIKSWSKLGRPMIDSYPSRMNLETILRDAGKAPSHFTSHLTLITYMLRWHPRNRVSALEGLRVFRCPTFRPSKEEIPEEKLELDRDDIDISFE
jgi:serine/threonine protein kinase